MLLVSVPCHQLLIWHEVVHVPVSLGAVLYNSTHMLRYTCEIQQRYLWGVPQFSRILGPAQSMIHNWKHLWFSELNASVVYQKGFVSPYLPQECLLWDFTVSLQGWRSLWSLIISMDFYFEILYSVHCICKKRVRYNESRLLITSQWLTMGVASTRWQITVGCASQEASGGK